MQMNLFDESLQVLIIFGCEFFHIGIIDGIIFLTIGTNVLVNIVSLRLKYAHTSPVEPVLTSITAYVKPVNGLDSSHEVTLRDQTHFCIFK